MQRLEQAIHHVASDQLFMVWGKSESDIRQAFTRAHMAGEIREGDPVQWCLWPFHSRMPAPRWTTMSTLSDEELKALIADLRDRLGSCNPDYEQDPRAWSRMTDAEIDAAVVAGLPRFDPVQFTNIADGKGPE
jgi:hypothetical protein